MLAAILMTLVITGCSNMNSNAAADSSAQTNAAIPLDADTSPTEAPVTVEVIAEPVSYTDASATPPRHALLELDFYDAPDYYDFEQGRSTPLSLEIEIQAALAEQR